jgi:hypothetical protein
LKTVVSAEFPAKLVSTAIGRLFLAGGVGRDRFGYDRRGRDNHDRNDAYFWGRNHWGWSHCRCRNRVWEWRRDFRVLFGIEHVIHLDFLLFNCLL